jgi:hypothetical protein
LIQVADDAKIQICPGVPVQTEYGGQGRSDVAFESLIAIVPTVNSAAETEEDILVGTCAAGGLKSKDEISIGESDGSRQSREDTGSKNGQRGEYVTIDDCFQGVI